MPACAGMTTEGGIPGSALRLGSEINNGIFETMLENHAMMKRLPVFVAFAAASLLWPAVAGRLVGVTLALLTAWLVRHDVARRTVHATALPRFAAVALLTGYAWLALAALWLVAGGAPGEGTAYDIVVHATFLGFAMSMVMAHAPVILPAVLGVRLPYRPVMYAPLVLLHLGLVERLLVGHLPGAAGAWAIGAATNVAALLLFVAVALGVAIHAHHSHQTEGTRP